MKKILKIIFIILLIILIKFIYSFTINEIIIFNYNKKIYNTSLIKTLYILNFNQPYIAYYNEGNILYNKENYKEAINKYNKAISKNPPQDKVCDVRINLSLSIIKNITSNDYKTVYNELEKAKNNLYNNNCANPIDNSGYSPDAEKLEEEIKDLQNNINVEFIKIKSDDTNAQEEEEKNEDYSDIEEELKQIEKESRADRETDLSSYENIGNSSYYSGKNW